MKLLNSLFLIDVLLYIYNTENHIHKQNKETSIYKVILITQITKWGLLLYINHCLIKGILLKSQSVDGEYSLFSERHTAAVPAGIPECSCQRQHWHP